LHDVLRALKTVHCRENVGVDGGLGLHPEPGQLLANLAGLLRIHGLNAAAAPRTLTRNISFPLD